MLGTTGSGNMVLTDEEIIENIKEGIERVKRFKEENKHPHALICNKFDESFNLKLIQIRDNEAWIVGEYHKIEITNCPFCSEGLEFGLTFDKMIESMKKDMEVERK